MNSDPTRKARLMAEANALAHEAQALTAEGRLEEAAERLERAAELALAAPAQVELSRYRYTQALLLAQVPARRKEAEALWRKAVAAATMEGRRDLQAKAYARLVALHMEDGDWSNAIGACDLWIRVLEPDGASAELAGALRQRAHLCQLGAGQDDSAPVSAGRRRELGQVRADLARTVEIAEAIGDRRLALQVRLELRVVESVMPGQVPEPFFRLRREAEELGNAGLVGSVELQSATEAMRKGEPKAAQNRAEAARRAALQSRDPVLYMLACMVIAEARETMGDRPGVLDILLTCKKSLEQLLGKEAGLPVVVVLDSLVERWGRDEVEKALATYRARMKSTPA